MEREKTYPEVLQKARGVIIVRLDEDRVELRTMPPGLRNYLQMAFVLGICAILFFGLVIGLLSAVGRSADSSSSLILGGIGVILLTGIILFIMWGLLYDTLPMTFLTDTKSRKCTHTYLKFFRREIPFEDIEYIEEDSNRNGVGFYLKEEGKHRRRCILFANGFTKSMGVPEAAVRILTREFEKNGITFPERKEGFFSKLHGNVNAIFWIIVLVAIVISLVILPVVELAVQTVEIAKSASTTGTIIELPEHSEDGESRGIAYSFIVDGKSYTSAKLLPDGLVFSESEDCGESLRDFHAVGEEVTVYYNPARPEKAHLHHGWNLALIVIASFIWGIMFIVLQDWFKKKERLRSLVLLPLGLTILIYGLCAVIISASIGGIRSNAVLTGDIHWHILAFICLFAIWFAFFALQSGKHSARRREGR